MNIINENKPLWIHQWKGTAISILLAWAALAGLSLLLPHTPIAHAAEPQIQFVAASFSASEGDITALITVTLDITSEVPITVDVASANGTASSLEDYAAMAAQLIVPAGQDTLTFTVPITDDGIYEGDEAFGLTLSNPQSATLGLTSSATVTITENESQPTVQFSTASFSVGENSGPAVVTVTLSGQSAFAVNVTLTTTNGTASSASDYAAVSQVLSFPALSTLVTSTIALSDDVVYEDNESFTVGLSAPSNATLGGTSSATVSIVENESQPTVQFSTASFSVSENSGPAVVTVTLSGQSAFVVNVTLTTTNGTASSLSDFAAVSRVLTISALSTSITTSIIITDDLIYEANESFTVGLSAPSNATLGGTSSAQVTITSNEALPTIAFTAAGYLYAENAPAPVITLTLNRLSAFPVTVTITSTDGSASRLTDYAAISRALTVPPMALTLTATLPITDETLYESAETFTLGLSNALSGTLGVTKSAIITITNDDPLPSAQFALNPFTALETEGNAVITVTLTNPSAFTATVNYATSAGTAVPGTNYTDVSGTLTFTPGNTSQSFAVPLLHNAFDEPDKTVNLTLSNPLSLGITGINPAMLYIVDVEGVPNIRFQFNKITVAENVGLADADITLSNASEFTITVNVVSTNGTAISTRDYAPVSATVTIPGGQQLADVTLSVPITDDNWYDGNHAFTLALSNPTNAALAIFNTSTVITITDNDSLPTIQFSNSLFSSSENAASTTVTVTLNRPSVLTTTVNYATVAGTALAGQDYLTATGTLTFAPGTLQQTFAVTLIDDSTYDVAKTLQLALGSAVNASIGAPAPAMLLIADNDTPPTIQFSSSLFSVAEGSGSALITATLTGPTALTATAVYSASNGTAQAGQDYTAITDTLSFAPGQNTLTFTVPILNDIRNEYDETVNLQLTSATSATLGTPATATLTLVDDDPLPSVQLSIASQRVYENASTALITLTLNLAAEVPVSATLATQTGTASPADFTPLATVVNFPPLVTQVVIPVSITNDVLNEPVTETFSVSLTQPVNAVLGALTTAQIILTDDDPPTPACASGCYSFASANVPVAIPDNTSAGIDSVLVITSTGLVANVVIVHIDEILHTYTPDVTLTLIAPTGQSVPLVAAPGLGGENFIGLILDEAAPYNLNNCGSHGCASPWTGRYQPDGDLTALKGIVATGTWKLRVADTAGGNDVGAVYAWSLEIQSQYNLFLPLIRR